MACSCLSTDTVEKQFEETPNIAVLKLQSINQNEGEPAKYILSVEKVFKGGLKIDEVLTFDYSVCAISFSQDEIGTEVLFYLGKSPAKGELWSLPSCTSRSGRVKSRTADLSYLKNEKNLRGKTRLSGKLQKFIETLDEERKYLSFPVSNQKIRIVGKSKTLYLTTDENGVYDIYDLSPGKYKIFPNKLNGFTFETEKKGFAEVEIKPKSHTEQDFLYEIDNIISGKIVNREGKPIEGICVDLYSMKTEKVLGFSHKSCSDEDGEFIISAIPTGSYKIVINDEDVFDRFSQNPFFEKFYYPNAETLEKAALISVEANFFLKDLLLVPRETKETITLSGRVIYADGKPAANQTVQFVKNEDLAENEGEIIISDFEVKTDKSGVFTIKTLKGQSGMLRGSFYFSSEDRKNCPEILKTLVTKDSTIQQLETNRLEITGTENLNGIELKYPFPFCKEIEQ